MEQHTLTHDILKPQSWGDRLKKPVFDKTVYVGLNFFVNLFGSAAFAYKVEKHLEGKTGKDGKPLTLQSLSEEKSIEIAKRFGISEAVVNNGAAGLLRSFLLSVVGHVLAPFIKLFEDHRQSVQFKIGIALDRLQEALGHGNAASRQNLADYYKLKEARYSPDITFTDAERERLWEKHHLERAEQSQNFNFKEHRVPWLKLITARVVGWLVAEFTGATMGASKTDGLTEEQKKRRKYFSYTYYEGKMIEPMTRALNFFGLNKRFDTKRYSELAAYDIVLTMASSGTHKIVQSVLHHSDDARQESNHKPFAKSELAVASSHREREEKREAERAEAGSMHYA